MYFQLPTNLTNQSVSLSMNPTNRSDSLSDMNNQSQSRYVWAPVPASFRWTVAAVMILVAVGSCLGNGMVLYLVKIQSTRSLRALQRTLTRHFIRSLAWSSLLTSLVSIPLMVSSLLVDYLKTDWACRAQRYLESVFIFITINNLIVIGVERYLVIYKPSKVPTTETTKRLVKAAWVMGAILTIAVPGSTTMLQRLQVANDKYTLYCASNHDVKGKVTSLIVSPIEYIIPGICLIITSVRVLKFLHRRRQQAHPLQVPSTFSTSVMSTLWYYKDSYMFASLTLAFFLPYIAPTIYSVFRNFIPYDKPFIEIYVSTKAMLTMCYTNAIINPIIYLYCMREMRQRIREMLSSVCLLR